MCNHLFLRLVKLFKWTNLYSIVMCYKLVNVLSGTKIVGWSQIRKNVRITKKRSRFTVAVCCIPLLFTRHRDFIYKVYIPDNDCIFHLILQLKMFCKKLHCPNTSHPFFHIMVFIILQINDKTSISSHDHIPIDN